MTISNVLEHWATIYKPLSHDPFEFNEYNWIANEKPEVVKAMTILARAGIYLSISGHEYMMREKALCANNS